MRVGPRASVLARKRPERPVRLQPWIGLVPDSTRSVMKIRVGCGDAAKYRVMGRYRAQSPATDRKVTQFRILAALSARAGLVRDRSRRRVATSCRRGAER